MLDVTKLESSMLRIPLSFAPLSVRIYVALIYPLAGGLSQKHELSANCCTPVAVGNFVPDTRNFGLELW